MISPMLFVRIIGPKTILPSTVANLYRLQCLHLTEVSQDQYSSVRKYQVPAELVEQSSRERKLLAEVNGLLELFDLPIPEPRIGNQKDYSLDEMAESLAQLSQQVRKLFAHKQKLAEEADLLPVYARKIEQILPYLPATASLHGYATIGLFVRQGHEHVSDLIHQEINKLTEGEVDFSGFNLDKETSVVLVITKASYITRIENWLRDENIPQFEWPEEIGSEQPATALELVRSRIQKLPAHLAEVDAALEDIKQSYAQQLIDWQTELAHRVDMFAIYAFIAETGSLFVLQGWISRDKHDEFESELLAGSNQQLILEWMETPEALQSEIPVQMENRPIAQPFERLVRLYANPRHDDIDPSGWMALFLPLFFGMILGDIAYGLVLFLVTLLLGKRMRSGFMADIVKILRMGSVWAILFGFLFGEFLGTLGHSLGLRPIWLDRVEKESLMPLMLVAIGIGAAHMTLGLILGVWQAWTVKHRTHLLERAGMLVGLIGIFLLVAALAQLIPQVFTIPAVSVLVIGIAMLGYSIGKAGIIVGPIEFIGVLGNILSYIRIAAVGLASVYLAKVANDLAGYFGSLVVGVIVAVLFHGLNLVIGAFSPSIHSLRLMYVEFFRKFYEGGGKTYHPYGLKETKV